MIKLRPAIEICKRTISASNITIRGAEIGVLGGGHAVTILANWPEIYMLHLVDSYGGIKETDPQFLAFREKFSLYERKMHWHIKTSLAAAPEVPDGSLDFCYIDANHRYFEVAQDIRAWRPKVRPGGIICGHDYFSHGSVKKAVDDWAAETNNYIFSTAPDWWCFNDI